jgi:cellulose synthase/poly-beta-1,6-N-acetylglucosamine synthase-like glycosyltransferase
MQEFASGLLTILALLIAVPTAVLCLEIAVGTLRSADSARPSRDPNLRVAVLVPARNEAAAIATTLQDVKPQLLARDTLLVVADNCTDDTAAVARQSGVEVAERHDLGKIGKGYALDWGLRRLEAEPPDIVVMVDADCRVAPGAIDQLVAVCSTTKRPVQALYLMTEPTGSTINHQIAEFAWRVKNWVRPLGLAGLNLPCQLMGAGMAFPWNVIRTADLAHAWIVEDLKLGLELTASGHPPLFCPTAVVTSHFAASRRGTDIQRRRWEHGHIVTILRKTPSLLFRAISHGNTDLLALTLDLSVPPLSLLAILSLAMFVVTGLTVIVGVGSIAFVISILCLAAFSMSIGLAWKKYGREVLPLRNFSSLPAYVFSKLGIYRQALRGKMIAHWVGTDRAKS